MRTIQQSKLFFAAIAAVVLTLAAGIFILRLTAFAQTAASTSTETTAQKQQDLENQLAALQGQIDQYQTQITADQKKGTSLKPPRRSASRRAKSRAKK